MQLLLFRFAFFVVLGIALVSLSTATVSLKKENVAMRAEIKTAQSTRANLEVQRSVLADGSRIDRIATQNMGMVLATSGETIDVTSTYAKAEPEADGIARDENGLELPAQLAGSVASEESALD